MHDFTRLRVWQRAQKLTLAIYRDTADLDEVRHPGLGARMRRAAGAIPACIAEGSTQPTPVLLARSLMQAIAFCTELLSHMDIALELQLIAQPRHVMLSLEVQELRRMLYALRSRVLARARAQAGPGAATLDDSAHDVAASNASRPATGRRDPTSGPQATAVTPVNR